MKVEVSKNVPPAYVPKTLSITFESELEEESFTCMCACNMRVADTVREYARSMYNRQVLKDMLGALYQNLNGKASS